MLERYEDPVETPHDGYERIGIRSHANFSPLRDILLF